MNAETKESEADDQPIVDDSETADVPVEHGPWDDEDYFERYLY